MIELKDDISLKTNIVDELSGFSTDDKSDDRVLEINRPIKRWTNSYLYLAYVERRENMDQVKASLWIK